MSVVVVTDSAAGLPAELVQRHAIGVVPLHVLIDGTTYREGIDTVPDANATRNITTSGASPGELRVAYEQAYELSGGDGVVAVHISRKLSGTWEAARQAVDRVDGRVRLVDSSGAGLGTGLAALSAARCARSGAVLDQVYRVAVAVAQRVVCYLVVDRLEQLRRGGRVGAAALDFGTTLVARPLLRIAGGRILLADKARTASRAIDKLVDAAVRTAGNRPVMIGVQHLEASVSAQRVVDQLLRRVPRPADLLVTEFGPTLGVHLGSGSVGVVVVPAQPSEVTEPFRASGVSCSDTPCEG